ncbi:MAG: anhydro-N-acetylmuramic acid kinase [Bacteroidota bacterium]
MQQYKVIGVMSGTSMDGVDLAYCVFTHQHHKWHYSIEQAKTIPYDDKWITRLTQLHAQPAFVYPKTDAFYGKYLGLLINDFIKEHQIPVDLISSHGHTIFHQPQNGFTSQIGSGASIYAETGIRTINDFRVVDVALGGQGAPLVPIGDELLFTGYDACLNLGGFSNISFNKAGRRTAFDISPCNIVLNKVAQQAGLLFDENGRLARAGTINEELLHKLNALPYYLVKSAKSLGIEWVEKEFWPLLKSFTLTIEDLMATLNYHISIQIAEVIKSNELENLLVTGGGAFNKVMIEYIETGSGIKITPANNSIIHYKEALIFAFLGVLRHTNQANSLRSVTGSRQDNMGGCIWG